MGEDIPDSGCFSEPELQAFGRRLSGAIEAPMVLFLAGDLGAGKTTLARALIQGLGHAGRVKSPTYGLLEHYELDGVQVLHLDLYRIEEAGELDFLGIEDLFESDTVLVVEWPERGASHLPPPDLTITLKYANGGRTLEFTPHSRRGREFVKRL